MKRISTVLIIVGIILAASPFIGKWYTNYQEQKLIDEWLNSVDPSQSETSQLVSDETEPTETIDPEEVYSQLQDVFAEENIQSQDNNPESAADTNSTPADDITEPNPEQNPSPSPKPKPKPEEKQTVLGVITIPKIKANNMIVEGVKASNLRAGIGHIPGTAAPGQPGNSALAGHRNYTFGSFFNRLNEMQLGDRFSITTKEAEFIYEIFNIVEVLPDDTSVLRGSKDQNITTLITCTPIYVASHRLIVQGELVDIKLKNP